MCFYVNVCACVCAQLRLEAARKEAQEGLDLWEKEIREKLLAAKQQEGFDKFLRGQVCVTVCDCVCAHICLGLYALCVLSGCVLVSSILSTCCIEECVTPNLHSLILPWCARVCCACVCTDCMCVHACVPRLTVRRACQQMHYPRH